MESQYWGTTVTVRTAGAVQGVEMTGGDRSLCDGVVYASDASGVFDGEESGLFRRQGGSGPATPLSQQLWGADWRAPMPWTLTSSGVVAVESVAGRCHDFVCTQFPGLHEAPAGAAAQRPPSVAKARYVSLNDNIELRHGEQTIGVFIGAPEDWATYYCRILCIDRAHRSPMMIRRFCNRLFEQLTAVGVERFVAETGPTNTAMNGLFNKLGFVVSGQRLTERWGPLVRYTKYLDADYGDRFVSRFGA